MANFFKAKLLLPLGVLGACSIQPNAEESNIAAQKTQNTKPNVLFIAVDDLRDWLSYSTNFSNVKTPNFEKLAKSGVVFKNAYCAAAVCCASRSAIMSGISPSKSGIYENADNWKGDMRQHITLTRYFMDNGYYTAGYGKIYHGSGDLQYWHTYECGPFYNCPEKPDHPSACGNPIDQPDSVMYDWQRTQNAINMLQNDISSPLFLACGLILPHLPWNAPRRFFDMYPLDSIQLPELKEGDLDDIPPIGQKIALRKMHDHYCKDDFENHEIRWSHEDIIDSNLYKINIQAYLASVSFVDEQIGRLLDAWNNSKYSENGVVVLWGDHGWHMGEKDHWSKRTLWEEGTRAPLLFASNNLFEGDKVCTTPVSLLDIFPTLNDLCGLNIRRDIDGLSLKPLILNPDLPWDRGAVSFWGQDNVSVRSKNYRYIHYSDHSKELYDHRVDPNEWDNLATDPKYMPIINQHHKWVPKCAPRSGGKKSWFEENGIFSEL